MGFLITLGRIGMGLLIAGGGALIINDVSVRKTQIKGYQDLQGIVTDNQTLMSLVYFQAILMLMAGVLCIMKERIGSYLSVVVIII